MTLTQQQQAILDFETLQWGRAGTKEDAIYARFGGMSATRYAQVLMALVDRPEAMEYAPLLVNQLRRVRDARVLARSAR